VEAGNLLTEDPASDRAQELTARWMDLAYRSTSGDLELRAGVLSAWADRQNWPPALREQIASFHLEDIAVFLGKPKPLIRRNTIPREHERSGRVSSLGKA
jgi:hypothetical protein